MNIKNIVVFTLIALTSTIAHAANDYVILKNPYSDRSLEFIYGVPTSPAKDDVSGTIKPNASFTLKLNTNKPSAKIGYVCTEHEVTCPKIMPGVISSRQIAQAARSESKEINLNLRSFNQFLGLERIVT